MYKEFLEMKKHSQSSMDNTITFAPQSYLTAESLRDDNNNDKKWKLSNSPRLKKFGFSGLSSPKPRRLHSADIKKKALPQTSGEPHDEGYSTSSQNGGTPKSVISPNEVNVKKTNDTTYTNTHSSFKYTTLPKDFRNNGKDIYQQESKVNTLSNSQQEKCRTIPRNWNVTADIKKDIDTKALPVDNVVISFHQNTDKSDSDKRNTMSRKELEDLNDLLGMLDEERLDLTDENPQSNETPVIITSQNDSQIVAPKTVSHNVKAVGKQIAPVKVDETSSSQIVSPPSTTQEISSTSDVKSGNKLSEDFEKIVNELLTVGSHNNDLFTDAEFNVNDQSKSGGELKERSRGIELPQSNNSRNSNVSSHGVANERSLELELDESLAIINELNDSIEYENNENHETFHIEASSSNANDSGIDETIMPGIMREQPHDSNRRSHKQSKRNKNEDSKKHKHKEKSEHKHHRSKDGEGRSESEPRRSHKLKHADDGHRSGSVPRSQEYRTYQNGDARRNTYDSDERGRSKNRRSEPPTDGKDSEKKTKLDKRRSEPIVTNKQRIENDIEGGTVGQYKRRNTEGSKSNKNKKDKKSKSSTDGPKVVIPVSSNIDAGKTNEISLVPDKHALLKRNNSLHINPTSNEYMWDTADGKHRVYVRKEEDPGPLPKKTVLKEYNDNFQSLVRRQHASEKELKNQLGVSPEIIRMLQEEEKFWQKQQELKQWRETQDARNSGTKSTPPAYNKQRLEYNRGQNTGNYEHPGQDIDRHHSTRRHHSKTEEELREEEEDRIAREAERMMRIRAEQEHVLKTSRENLLRDSTDHYKPPKDPNKYQNGRATNSNRQSYPPDIPENQKTLSRHGHNSSRRSHPPDSNNRNQTSFKKTIRDPNLIEKNYKAVQKQHQDSILQREEVAPFSLSDRSRHNSWGSKAHSSASSGIKSPDYDTSPTSPNRQNGFSKFSSTSPPYTATSERVSRSSASKSQSNRPYACFSDDDEVFHETRREKEQVKNFDEHRGYFSDYEGGKDNTIERTLLARPLIRPKHAQVRCTACCRVISDERLMHVEGQNYYWHLKCFLCTVCRAYLNDKHAIRVRIVQYNLHCRFCFSANTGEQCSEV